MSSSSLSPSEPRYTTSSLFLLSLANAGITHLFVNWGSDHPGLLEDLQRQRVESSGEAQSHDDEGKEARMKVTQPQIITCPNEMVALSAAQGYAQVLGKPAGVIVHVDVGTQALAGAVHNVDRARVPVIVYAGASPVGSFGDAGKGTRNEWILWLQDIPDQPAIVRQYMRHTVQIESPLVMPKVVRRAMQIACSAPKGPAYLWARREVMEAEVGAEAMQKERKNVGRNMAPVEPAGLSPRVLKSLTQALLASGSPLILTSSLGTNTRTVPLLSKLATILAIPVVQVCPSAVNLGFDHPCCLGVTYLAPGTHSPLLKSADLILVLDCLLPWIPNNDRPGKDAKVYWADSGDVLGRTQGNRHLGEELEGEVVMVQADGEVVLEQIVEEVLRVEPALDVGGGEGGKEGSEVAKGRDERMKRVREEHGKMIEKLIEIETTHPPSVDPQPLLVPNILATLRTTLASYSDHPSATKEGLRVLYLNESISNYPLTWNHLRPTRAGEMITSGGSSLGWALGAAVGASIAGEVMKDAGEKKRWDIIVLLVGDGSFLFGVPGSAYWMARRYNTPFLTLILNNTGWKSPRNSMAAVHPLGHGAKLTSRSGNGDTLGVGFGPRGPDYVGLARAASGGDEELTASQGGGGREAWCWGRRIGGSEAEVKSEGKSSKNVAEELEEAMRGAVKAVVEEGRCAVLDCLIERV